MRAFSLAGLIVICVFGACSSEPVAEKGEKDYCGLLPQRFAACAEASDSFADDYCSSGLSGQLGPEELSYCHAYVRAALDAELAAGPAASCRSAMEAQCSASEVALLNGCSECLRTLGCDQLYSMFVWLDTASVNGKPLFYATACPDQCMAVRDISDSCAEAVEGGVRAWNEANRDRACTSPNEAYLDECRLDLSCTLSCSCDSGCFSAISGSYSPRCANGASCSLNSSSSPCEICSGESGCETVTTCE